MTHDELMALLTRMFAMGELGLIWPREEPGDLYLQCPACDVRHEVKRYSNYTNHIDRGEPHQQDCNLMRLYLETLRWNAKKD